MARIITKELAENIASKLRARKVPRRRGSAHDLYDVEYRGFVVAQFNIRHGSNRQQGHDFIPRSLHISPHQARELGRCPLSVDDYFTILREKGLLPADETSAGEARPLEREPGTEE